MQFGPRLHWIGPDRPDRVSRWVQTTNQVWAIGGAQDGSTSLDIDWLSFLTWGVLLFYSPPLCLSIHRVCLHYHVYLIFFNYFKIFVFKILIILKGKYNL